MKPTNSRSVILVLCLIFSIGSIQAQAPFGPNLPGGSGNPPGDDKNSSPSSVAGTGRYSSTNSAEVFYSLASDDPDMIIYKMSNVLAQPWLRKKFQKSNESFGVDNNSLYPNPNTGQFEVGMTSLIDQKVYRWTIYDTAGKEVLKGSSNPVNQVLHLDVNLKNGTYIMEIFDGEAKLYQKLSISK